MNARQRLEALFNSMPKAQDDAAEHAPKMKSQNLQRLSIYGFKLEKKSWAFRHEHASPGKVIKVL